MLAAIARRASIPPLRSTRTAGAAVEASDSTAGGIWAASNGAARICTSASNHTTSDDPLARWVRAEREGPAAALDEIEVRRRVVVGMHVVAHGGQASALASRR